MLQLIKYADSHRSAAIKRIADFFSFHAALIHKKAEQINENLKEAEKTLKNWLQEDHDFYMIEFDNSVVGFLHIGYRGANVAWIEDIYVDPDFRNRGIASNAIHLAENIIKGKPGYTAICFDLVPRNEAALRLYYKLGYNNLSLITVRKELCDNKRDRKETVLGLEFKI